MINESLTMDTCICGRKKCSKKIHTKICSVSIDNRYNQNTVIDFNLS